MQTSNHAEPDDPGSTAMSAFDKAKLEIGDAPEYKASRNELLNDERKHESSWQGAARSNPLRSGNEDVETQAAEVIHRLREKERIDPQLFGNLAGEDVPPPETRDMGGRYLRNRKNIDRSKLFRIACMVPKGAHLHLHFNSELRPEFLFPFASQPHMDDTFFVRATRPLCSQDAFDNAEIVFNVLDKKEIALGNVFSERYDPDWKKEGATAWMRWKDFREQFPSSYPSRKKPKKFSPEEGINEHHAMDRQTRKPLSDAELWATEKMVITQNLRYHRACTHNDLWACFNQGTRAFKGLLNYEGIYRAYIGKAIDHMIEDRVMYAELRPMLLDKTIPSDDGTRDLDHKAQMTIILEEVDKKQRELGKSIDRFPFGLKIIYCAPRSIVKPRMEKELQDCIKLALQFKDRGLICGFDLVGAEDRPNNIGHYADLLLAFKKTCKALDLDIPFMFHAGETLLDTGGSSEPDNSNLYDALLLGAKRIGHGYSMIKHPLLIEKYRKANIALELCPISNELLGLCGNAREHPYPALLAMGLHCTLNADNPSLFRGTSGNSSSLSHEFYQVMAGDPRMTLFGWRQLAEWSIEHSCLSDAEKKRGIEILRARWVEFCRWVVEGEESGWEAGLPF